MNISDLMTALSTAQNNPMFNMGLGMLQASGPHFGAPTSFGQALAAGQQYQQAAQAKQMQNQIMGYQAQRAGYLNDFIKRGIYGSGMSGNQSPVANPNADPALAATAGIRAQDATDPVMSGMVYGSNGFTNGISATPTQIGSQDTPTVSGAGAAALGLQPQAAQGQPQPSAAQATQMQAPQGAPGSSGTGGVGAAMLKDPMYYLAFGLDPNAATTSYLNQQYPQPTDAQKLVTEMGNYPVGSPQRMYLQSVLAKQGSMMTKNGGYMPGMGMMYMPSLPDGAMLRDPFNPGAGVFLPPGMAQAAGQMAAANAYPKEAAKAAYAYPIAQASELARAQYTPTPAIVKGVPTQMSEAAILGGAASGAPVQTAFTPQQKAEGTGLGKENAANINATQAAAQAAQMSQLSNKQILADAQTFTTGRFADYKGEALSVLNGLGIKADPAGLQSYQDMQKLLVSGALDRTRQMGSREAAQIVNMVASKASPNVKMAPESLAQLVKFNQIPAQEAQIKNQAMDSWRQQGLDVSHFGPQFTAANIPAILAYQQLSPAQQEQFRKANPDAMNAMAHGYDIAAHNGWTSILKQASGL